MMNFPNDPQVNETFTTNNGVYIFDGVKWSLITKSNKRQHVGDTPPEQPGKGQLWWNTNDASLYIYYKNYWTQIGSSPQIDSELSSIQDTLFLNVRDGEINWDHPYWAHIVTPTVSVTYNSDNRMLTTKPIEATSTAFVVEHPYAPESHVETDWKLISTHDGSIIWQLSTSSDLTSVTIPANTITACEEAVSLYVRYRSNTLESAWGAIEFAVSNPMYITGYNLPGPECGIYDETSDTGYYGETDVISSTDLASSINFNRGGDLNKNTWFKFYVGPDAACNRKPGKPPYIIYVAKEPFRYNVDWYDINNIGAVYGSAQVTVNNIDYVVRCIQGVSADATQFTSSTCADNVGENSEWNDLMYRMHVDIPSCSDTTIGMPGGSDTTYHGGPQISTTNWADFSDVELCVTSSDSYGSYTWCQEFFSTYLGTSRGGLGIATCYVHNAGIDTYNTGWRPVLEPEIIDEPSVQIASYDGTYDGATPLALDYEITVSVSPAFSVMGQNYNLPHYSTEWLLVDANTQETAVSGTVDTGDKELVVLPPWVVTDGYYFLKTRYKIDEYYASKYNTKLIQYETRNIINETTLTVTGTQPDGYTFYFLHEPLIISTTDMVINHGDATHVSTDWWIDDSTGNTIFESIKDTANLTSITIPGNSLVAGNHTIHVMHRNSNGAVSYPATSTIELSTPTIGGTTTVSGTNTIHSFYESGSLEVFVEVTADVLVVAGGGGGGATMGGGGGAGGLILNTVTLPAGTYTVVIGAGGTGGIGYNALDQSGSQGSDSSFHMTTATGGGGGAGWRGSVSAGGSGGGGNERMASSAGIPGQGYDGGRTTISYSGARTGGGGGGASAAGTGNLGAGIGGHGGDGTLFEGVYYAGGGGGGTDDCASCVGGPGGLGGGGAGSAASIKAEDGQPNTGGGGGGAGYSGSSTDILGGTGGSGIVIVRVTGVSG